MQEHAFDLHSALVSTIFFLAATCICVPLSKRLGLGAVLGYLIAGIIVGPFGLKLFLNGKDIIHFAEIGVVFLLFLIGLELNLSKLWDLRKSVFGMGLLQFLITGFIIGALVFVTRALGILSITQALLIGATLAMSSTAFAIQTMQEKGELQTSYGQAAFAILLFQDLVAIPVMALIGLLGDTATKSEGSTLIPVLKAVGMILLVIFVGRFLLKHAFRLIAKTRAKEVFTAASLLIVIGVSLMMESVGLSMALGAFLSGVILADSEYCHELEADIEPFKGLLLGLFFMAVGMNINLEIFLERPLFIIFLTLALMLIKWLILVFIAKAMKFNIESAKCLGIFLCQGGEFGFVIIGLMLGLNLVNQEINDTFVLVVTFSIAFSPIVLALYDKLSAAEQIDEEKEFDKNFETKEPEVIIAGFGRYGQTVARMLMMQKIPFTTLEHSPENVETAGKFGCKIYYGDASRLDLLHSAGAAEAKIFILAIDDVESSVRIAEILVSQFPKLKIFARARNRAHVFRLQKLGITIIHRELFASSLEMSRDVLLGLNMNKELVERIVTKFRNHDEELLALQYSLLDNIPLLESTTRDMNLQLEQLFVADAKEDDKLV